MKPPNLILAGLITGLGAAQVGLVATQTATSFHDGGVVGGPGGQGGLRADEVPAILQTGELVLSRDQVAALRGDKQGGVLVINVDNQEEALITAAENSERFREVVISMRDQGEVGV